MPQQILFQVRVAEPRLLRSLPRWRGIEAGSVEEESIFCIKDLPVIFTYPISLFLTRSHLIMTL